MNGRNDLKLGRIAGIEVRLNWTILIIAALLTITLATTILPAQASGFPSGAYFVAGLLGAFALLGSILAHEMAHAIVARRNGVKVDGITLWLFGGVARLDGEAPDPAAEARIAGVGPATSVGLAVLGAGAAIGTALLGASDLMVALLWWLAIINAVLAVFNMLPGAPLDGGRLLHAFLWARHGDRIRATVTASRAGKALGYGLIAFGFFEVFAFGSFGGIWTALIGWFLVGAAGQEASWTIAKHSLDGLTVGDVMGPRPVVAPDWITVSDFIDTFVVPTRASLFVLQGFDGVPSGVVSIDDLHKAPAPARSTTRIRAVATPIEDDLIVAPSQPAEDVYASSLGTAGRTWRAVVVNAGQLVGIVTANDIAQAIKRHRLLGKKPPTPTSTLV